MPKKKKNSSLKPNIKPSLKPTLNPQSNNFTNLDIFCFVVILIVGLKILYYPYNLVDIMLADESYYLFRANHFQLKYLFTDGFVYFLWLKFLSLYFTDMVELYLMNYSILVVLNPMLFYFLSKKMGRSSFVSLFLAIIFLGSTANVFTWPFITRFALAIFLVTLLVVLGLKTNKEKFVGVGIGLLVLLYVRPEFLLSFLLFAAIIGLFMIIKVLKSRQQEYIFLLACLTVAVCFVSMVRSPASPQRSLFAFGQHYGANLVEREKIKLNPWTQWQTILDKKFGDAQSVFDLVLKNPNEITKHVFANTKKVVPTFYYQLFPFDSHNLSRLSRKIMSYAIIFLIFLTLIRFCLDFWRRYKAREPGGGLSLLWVGDELSYVSLTLLVLLPPAVSLLLVYPRTHYILFVFGACYVFFIKYVPKFPQVSKKWTVATTVLIVFLLYILPWTASDNPGIFPGRVKVTCTTAIRIQTIKDIPIKANVRLLFHLYDIPFNTDYFLMYIQNHGPYQYQFFKPDAGVPFRQFIENNNINMIYVNRKLVKNMDLVANEELFSMMSNVASGPWTRLEVPGGDEFILVKKEILNVKKVKESKELI